MLPYAKLPVSAMRGAFHAPAIPMNFRHLLSKARGQPLEFNLSPYRDALAEILTVSESLITLPDNDLQARSKQLAQQISQGTDPDTLIVPAAALVRESCRRILDMTPFDVQIMAGIALYRGRLVEMQTGEGKTLAAIFPAYMSALSGQGVHIFTANDYLARRDARWMGPVYEFLGLSVGFIQETSTPDERRRAYRKEITYATAREAGFDHLRDHLAMDSEAIVHHRHHVAMVDEADFIMIDEARMPLVIAGGDRPTGQDPYAIARFVRTMEPGTDYDIDEYARNIHLTDAGIDRVQDVLNCPNLHDPDHSDVLCALNCALHADVLLERDRDYIVRDGNVEIVDEFTGRVADNRHWPDGLQAAVEAKESIRLKDQGRILGSITLQHFLMQYDRICGMTATAQTAAHEFFSAYNLTVTVIPPNRPNIRMDHPDRVFSHRDAKHTALIDEIHRVHNTDRPVLVGTASVSESEILAQSLKNTGIPCTILNAKNNAQEAEIISRAGLPGAVTISTNMAGRGTDIRLGGPDQEHYEQVAGLGGLYVIGTNRHESIRIDNQLRGRAGRQGDPGSSRFFISLEDDLMVRYRVKNLIPKRFHPQPQPDPVHNPVIHREIARAQRIIDGQNGEIRKTLLNYSNIVDQQRDVVMTMRHRILTGKDTESILETLWPEQYQILSRQMDPDTLKSTERDVQLAVIDLCWADHLAWISDVREGIHLVKLGNQDPLFTFQKRMADEFTRLLARIETMPGEILRDAVFTEEGFDLETAGLKGPSATWTYMISDDQFKDDLTKKILGSMVGGAAAAFALGPVLILWGLYERFRTRKKRVRL